MIVIMKKDANPTQVTNVVARIEQMGCQVRHGPGYVEVIGPADGLRGVDVDMNALPDATHHRFDVTIDGYGPDTVDLGTTAVSGSGLNAKLGVIAARIASNVRALKPTNPAYRHFTF